MPKPSRRTCAREWAHDARRRLDQANVGEGERASGRRKIKKESASWSGVHLVRRNPFEVEGGGRAEATEDGEEERGTLEAVGHPRAQHARRRAHSCLARVVAQRSQVQLELDVPHTCGRS